MIDGKLLRSPRNSLKASAARAGWTLMAAFGMLSLQPVSGAEIGSSAISGNAVLVTAPDLLTSASFLGGLGVLLFTHMLRSRNEF